MREVLWHEGDVVRKLRAAAGWKLEELSTRAGVSVTSIHDLEVGRTKEAARATLAKLAGAFGLTRRQLEDLVPKEPVRLDVPEPQASARKSRAADTGAPARRKKGA